MTIAGYAIGASRGHPLPARRVRLPARRTSRTCWPRRRAEGLLGKDICGKAGLRLRHPHPDGRRRLRLRRGDGADQLLRGPARRSRRTARRSRPRRATSAARPRSTTSRRSAACRASWRRAPAGSPRIGSTKEHRHQAAEHLRRLHAPGRLRGAVRHPARATCSSWPAPRTRRPCRSAARAGQMIGAERLRPDDLLRRSGHRRRRSWSSAPSATCSRSPQYFMDFFIEESCGYCTPCRVGNVLLKERLDAHPRRPRATPGDLDYLRGAGRDDQDRRAAAAWARPRPTRF